MIKVPLTRFGAEQLKAELQQLKSVARPEVIAAIAEARSHGDLSENAEYDAAKERQGFIEGYTAILNPHFLDASLLVFVEITLNRGAPDVFEQFNTAVQTLEEIQECHLVSGDFDYLLKTRVSDMSAYRRLLGETLLRLPGVNDTRTYVVMEEVKQSNRLVISTK